jgi:hypothetical protein
MTIRVPGYIRLLLFTGVLALVPVQVSSDGLSYDEALANNAGGQGKGQGQGASHAGDHGAASANAGANGVGLAASVGATSKNFARFNALHASLKAWENAAPHTPIGIIAGPYRDALNAFADPALADPTLAELATILAQVANRGELAPESIEWINQQLVNKGLVEETTLVQASAILAPSNPDPTIQTPSLVELLADLTNSMHGGEINQGLGPIY